MKIQHTMLLTIAGISLFLGFVSLRTTASDPKRASAPLELRFRETVEPFIGTYCFECHGQDKPKGDLDLRAYSSLGTFSKDPETLDLVLEQLQSGAMPPAKAKRQPTTESRRDVVAWFQALRRDEAKRHAGDPGSVPARRLSNAEYDHTIRDLTGVDIRPTAEFPVDPANEAGFDNSAESLMMSPALVKKYLEAARRIAEHVVLKPVGFAFADHPAVADTDRDKYCVRRIINFYKRQATDYADYFMAAWRYRHRTARDQPDAELADVAAEAKISPKYLSMIWSTLTGPAEDVGPVAALQAMWRALPPAEAGAPLARAGCERMRDVVVGAGQGEIGRAHV